MFQSSVVCAKKIQDQKNTVDFNYEYGRHKKLKETRGVEKMHDSERQCEGLAAAVDVPVCGKQTGGLASGRTSLRVTEHPMPYKGSPFLQQKKITCLYV